MILHDFTCLKTGKGKILVEDADYGRQECVLALVAGAEGAASCNEVTPFQGREVQLVVEALVASKGDWIELSQLRSIV